MALISRGILGRGDKVKVITEDKVYKLIKAHIKITYKRVNVQSYDHVIILLKL